MRTKATNVRYIAKVIDLDQHSQQQPKWSTASIATVPVVGLNRTPEGRNDRLLPSVCLANGSSSVVALQSQKHVVTASEITKANKTRKRSKCDANVKPVVPKRKQLVQAPDGLVTGSSANGLCQVDFARFIEHRLKAFQAQALLAAAGNPLDGRMVRKETLVPAVRGDGGGMTAYWSPQMSPSSSCAVDGCQLANCRRNSTALYRSTLTQPVRRFSIFRNVELMAQSSRT